MSGTSIAPPLGRTPWNGPPFGRNTFRDIILLTTVPGAIGSTPIWTVATRTSGQPTFKVPPHKWAVVAYFALDTNSPVGDAFVRFRFTINGNVLDNYQSPPVAIGDIDDPSPVYQELRSDDRFNVELTNLDTSRPWDVTVRVIVWAFGRGRR